MSTATYDYPALKAAHAKLSAEIENYEAIQKAYQSSGEALVAENNAPGVKETMASSAEQMAATVQIARTCLEEVTAVLNVARELHVANGGEE